MNEQNLTHWKKNNDSRYISGEDLQHELHGLKKEMVVQIVRYLDAETFDQKNQKNVMKTGFILSEIGTGRELYKPVILNNTNAKFCNAEFGSPYLEHWIGKTFVLYAQADKRHGYVARFRKHVAVAISDKPALELLNACKTLADLQKCYTSQLSAEEKKLPAVVVLKEQLKTTLK